MASPLRTDLYELNMAASYRSRQMEGLATFSLFIRDLPPTRGYLVAAGIEGCLQWLEELHVEEEDLEALAALGFSRVHLEALRGLCFTGDVWAVPEGRIVFANEPLLEVTAPIAEAQLVETALLNEVTFQSSIATKALRCRQAAGERIELVEFGMRRAPAEDAGRLAARASVMAGFAATSNVEAAAAYGLSAAGTMAHSYIEAFPDELSAFRAFAEDFPARATFLVDTYDTRRGVANAITVITERELAERAAIRIDSGELASESARARAQLDAAGLTSVRIMVSGALDEYEIARLTAAGAPIDAFGIGSRLVVSADAPSLDSVYKLVAYDGQPVAKLSAGKATLPGAKQVYRGEGMADLLALRSEEPPAGSLALLEAVMIGGRRLQASDARAALAAASARCQADLAALPEGRARLTEADTYEPSCSAALQALAAELHARLGEAPAVRSPEETLTL